MSWINKEMSKQYAENLRRIISAQSNNTSFKKLNDERECIKYDLCLIKVPVYTESNIRGSNPDTTKLQEMIKNKEYTVWKICNTKQEAIQNTRDLYGNIIGENKIFDDVDNGKLMYLIIERCSK